MRGSKPFDTPNATDRCPRCGGNLSKEFDALGGWDAACLQCGFRGPPPRPRAASNGNTKKRPRSAASRRHAGAGKKGTHASSRRTASTRARTRRRGS